MKEFAEEDDVDKLIQEFTRREEENYALFNYINEVNTELKNLSDTVKTLKVNIGKNEIIKGLKHYFIYRKHPWSWIWIAMWYVKSI